MRRVLLIAAVLCLATVAGAWLISDDWVTHVTIVTDKTTGRDFACFFGAEHMGYSRAMSCVRVGP